MSATPPPAQPSANAAPQAQFMINLQYIKDLSFEVPGAPLIYTTLRSAPKVDINLDVQVRRLQDGQNMFEVTLAIRAEAREGNPTGPFTSNSSGGPSVDAAGGVRVFLADLSYAGIVTLNNVAEAAVEGLLLVECPRLLFPFARTVLADVTRDGGFPPVMLQPIDFFALWQARRAQGDGQVAGTA